MGRYKLYIKLNLFAWLFGFEVENFGGYAISIFIGPIMICYAIGKDANGFKFFFKTINE